MTCNYVTYKMHSGVRIRSLVVIKMCKLKVYDVFTNRIIIKE